MMILVQKMFNYPKITKAWTIMTVYENMLCIKLCAENTKRHSNL